MSGFGSNQAVTSNGQSERSFDYEWTIFFFFILGPFSLTNDGRLW